MHPITNTCMYCTMTVHTHIQRVQEMHECSIQITFKVIVHFQRDPVQYTYTQMRVHTCTYL